MTQVLEDVDLVGTLGDPGAAEVTGIAYDSRAARPGSLFCCVPGATTDGHDHAEAAVRAGAVGLVCERFLDLDVPQARVAPGGIRPAMARMAATFHGHPSRSLTMIGITGTNGKTTVAHLLRSVLDAAGMPAGVVGTLYGTLTTPEAPVLHDLLAGFRDGGKRAVAMEVSSHALTQSRVDGIVFDVAAFTNLSHDHLDHHHTMEEYFAAKARLFEPGASRFAVVNADDPWGARLLDRLDPGRAVPVRRSDASAIELSVGSSAFRWRGRHVRLPLTGMFNVDNALTVATVATVVGVDEDVVVDGLGAAPPVPGRMEVVTPGPPFAVLVDFAHTPAGLEQVLSSTRRLAGEGRVVCVFGCGGDRDAEKRPMMGRIVSRLADVAVLTSDNPRTEDPLAILDDVRAGVDGDARLIVEVDRATAIERALTVATPGDVVVIAGKGHETAQLVGESAVAFDDRVEVRRALGRLGMGGAR